MRLCMQDYDLFYQTEIELRKMLNYPPFCDIILIRFQGKNLEEIQKVAHKVYQKIDSAANNSMIVYAPVPAPIDKIKNKYRWRMIIKCKVTSKVLNLIQYSIEDAAIQKQKEISIIVDINPNNMS